MSASPSYGGPVECILRQGEVWEATGKVTNTIVSLDLPNEQFIKEMPIPTIGLGESNGLGAKIKVLGHYGYSSKFTPWLEANAIKYDFVIVHGLWNYAIFAASRILRNLGVPYYVYTHGMLDPWFKKAYPRKHLAKQLFWMVAEGPLLAKATGVLFTCEEERRLAQNSFIGHQSYRQAVVGLGTKAGPKEILEAESISVPSYNGPYLLYLSRIHAKKGCDLLVEAFSRISSDYPKLNLVIAGPDQSGLTKRLKELAQKLNIAERVHFPGALFGEHKWIAMRGAEAFVLPSHQENFGIVVAEALSAGLPVLISDKVNIWREVAEAGAGLVGPDTVEGTYNNMRTWLKMSDLEKSAMRKNCRAVFESMFNVERTALNLLDRICEDLRLPVVIDHGQ